jgi:LacI family transcriptional regulator
MAKKSISQQQIAHDLGVSQSLVSIVLNGRKDGIAPRTYERIWEYAHAHGYSPKGMKLDSVATGGETAIQSIGYFLRSPLRLATKSNFFSHVTHGLHEYAAERHVSTVFLGSEADYEPENFNRIVWREKFLRGVVIMGQVAPGFLQAVRRLGKPVVYVSARSPGLSHSVNSNEREAAELLVDHLYGLGHRHFAFLGGLCARSRQEERLLAVSDALAAHSVQLRPECRVELDDAERKQGYEMAQTLLERGLDPFPTAWICVNGLAARGAINKLREAGYRVGSEVSVAAIDMTRVCSEESPGITSAAAIPEDLGRAAARIILDHDATTPQPLMDVILPATLAVRESSGPLVGRRRATTAAAG